jgi:hypothetical protein
MDRQRGECSQRHLIAMATTLGRGPKSVKACEGIAQSPVIDIDKDPRESITTLAVLFSVAAGYSWGCPKPYLDLIEEMPDGRIERRVYWIFDSESRAEIEGENVGFAEFWERIHEPMKEAGTLRGTLNQLAQGLAILGVMPPADRSGKLRYWAGHASLTEQARSVFSEAATIHDQFLADRMPRFILVQQARGIETRRAYIPIHASAEERAAVLARAGIS